MALTSLIILTEYGEKHIQIETRQGDNGVIIHWYDCDENFNHTGQADASADKRNEEEYHTQLREAAVDRGQLVTSHSTNPEWNPEGYVRVFSQNNED